jgi:hypothetical protein
VLTNGRYELRISVVYKLCFIDIINKNRLGFEMKNTATSSYIRTIGYTFIKHITIKTARECLGYFKPEQLLNRFNRLRNIVKPTPT